MENPKVQTSARSFEQRFAAHGPRLRRQLGRLYGTEAELWANVEGVLRDRAADRPKDLVELDDARELNPDWFVAPDMIGYSTYVDRFGGTIDGVSEHIDHLQGLWDGPYHLNFSDAKVTLGATLPYGWHDRLGGLPRSECRSRCGRQSGWEQHNERRAPL